MTVSAVPAAPETAKPAGAGLPGLSTRASLIFISAVAIALFVIRLTGLPNFYENDYRLAACVLNAVQDGNWICPHDSLGNTDKPPMLSWLSALATWPFGHLTRFTLYLPTALATLALSWIIFFAGRRFFGWSAGFLAALAYLLSDVAAKQMAMGRWDGIFALPVAVGAVLAFRAWQSGRGWTWFWVVCALATLTKGPLGVLLAGMGLLACLWERFSGHPQPLRGSHWTGIALYLVISAGWFWLAYLSVGPHLVKNLIGDELMWHIMPGEHRQIGSRFYKPLLNFLGGYAPWCALAGFGLVRLCLRPAADDLTRRFERFVFCFFVGGLALFSLSSHNPGRLLLPLMPAAALIAGRALADFTRRLKTSTVLAGAAAVSVLTLSFFAVQYHLLWRKSDHVQRTLALKQLAQTVRDQVGASFPLAYALQTSDTYFVLQMWLSTFRPNVSLPDAAGLLRGDAAAFIVTDNVPALKAALGEGRALHELARCDLEGQAPLFLVSNHPRLEWTPRMAAGVGPLLVRMEGVKVQQASEHHFVFQRDGAGGSVSVVNQSPAPRFVRIRILGTGPAVDERRRLQPGETWRVGT